MGFAKRQVLEEELAIARGSMGLTGSSSTGSRKRIAMGSRVDHDNLITILRIYQDFSNCFVSSVQHW
jgi:hypothetical protein